MSTFNVNKISSDQARFDRRIVTGFFGRSYSSNLIFWLIYLFMMILSSFKFLSENEFLSFIVRQASELVVLLIGLIINIRLLLPKLLRKQKTLLYSGSLVMMGIMLASIQFLVMRFLVESGFNVLSPLEQRAPRGAFLFNAVPILFFVMLNLFLKIFQEWAKLQEIEKKLEEAQKEALRVQLENLKAQVNPHFLFNTLNNIYSLSLFNDKRTPETILKLSDLLSYMIYECRDDKVKVIKEMEFIENYTTLEKLRFNENATLNTHIDRNWNDSEMAPLIFAPFLENAFKHGMNIQSREPRISISVSNKSDNILNFVCENNTDNIKIEGPGGIGLKNVRARLELLYPNRYKLNITNNDGIYRVELSLDISKGPELSPNEKRLEK